MSLTTIQEIEQAIPGLRPEQRDELLLWVDRNYSQAIDDRLRTDMLAGRLDNRLDRALADDRAGKTRLL